MRTVRIFQRPLDNTRIFSPMGKARPVSKLGQSCRRIVVAQVVCWCFIGNGLGRGQESPAPEVSEQTLKADQLLDRFRNSFRFIDRGRCKVECITSVRHIDIPGGAYPEELVLCKETWGFQSDGKRQRIEKHCTAADVGKTNLGAHATDSVYVGPDSINSCAIAVDHIVPDSGSKDSRQHWDLRAKSNSAALENELPLFVDAGLRGIAFGFIGGDAGQSLIQVFRKGELLVDRDEQIDGHMCSVIRSSGQYGDRTLWLDPADGFRPKRLQITRAGNHLAGDRTVTSFDGTKADGELYPKLQTEKFMQDCGQFRFEQHGGASVMTHFIEEDHTFFTGGGHMIMKQDWSVTDIDLDVTLSDADFEVGMDIPDGMPVNVLNAGGIHHKWRGGRIIAANSGKPIGGARFSKDQPAWSGQH